MLLDIGVNKAFALPLLPLSRESIKKQIKNNRDLSMHRYYSQWSSMKKTVSLGFIYTFSIEDHIIDCVLVFPRN